MDEFRPLCEVQQEFEKAKLEDDNAELASLMRKAFQISKEQESTMWATAAQASHRRFLQALA